MRPEDLGDAQTENLYRRFFWEYPHPGLYSIRSKDWETHLDFEQPIWLDFGCYLGRLTVLLAQHHPHVQVIGLDRTYKRVVKTYLKSQRLQLENVTVLYGQGEELMSQPRESWLSGVCLFFPDPWTKRRQMHHRLARQDLFWNHLYRALRPNGFIWFKTDHDLLFQETLEQMKRLGLKVSDSTDHPSEMIPADFSSQFELLFLGKGVPIFRTIARKPFS